MRADVQSFDIQRLVTVYPDRAGVRWWAKAWINGSETGEPAVEIEERTAVRFIHGQIGKDAMLEECYPRQMETCRSAIEQTRERLLKQPNP